ncbi:MAG: secondary thiamine-phosphate synthase enzyme YjbQ [Candidatus Kariarchaeaceae archaeon]|jgi:secondary thiamine-phosphate synthase enzyme
MITGQLAIETRELSIQTQGEEIDLIDLTPELREFLQATPITDGRLTIFVPGSTASIIATEYEPYLNQDTKRIIKELVPLGDNYQHDRIDNNAHSHLRTSIFGSEMTIPVVNSRLTTGTWQQICFADFDTRPRRRTLVVQLMGIAPTQE